MRYVVCKRHQKWVVVRNDGTPLLEFEDMEEAFSVAWRAARLLGPRYDRMEYSSACAQQELAEPGSPSC